MIGAFSILYAGSGSPWRVDVFSLPRGGYLGEQGSDLIQQLRDILIKIFIGFGNRPIGLDEARSIIELENKVQLEFCKVSHTACSNIPQLAAGK